MCSGPCSLEHNVLSTGTPFLLSGLNDLFVLIMMRIQQQISILTEKKLKKKSLEMQRYKGAKQEHRKNLLDIRGLSNTMRSGKLDRL